MMVFMILSRRPRLSDRPDMIEPSLSTWNCVLCDKPNLSLIAYSSDFRIVFSRVSSSTRDSSTMSLRRRFSLDRLAASLFRLLRSQYESSVDNLQV